MLERAGRVFHQRGWGGLVGGCPVGAGVFQCGFAPMVLERAVGFGVVGAGVGWYGVAPLGLAKAGMVSHRWCWRGLAGFGTKGAEVVRMVLRCW